ncbi:hypothetical protein [Komagataeibacter diospyri]|uniref:hypothetical protein n=1 Tax=Komagataeibacter diospyri TaxID=1932662 RepID=UPI0037580B29
MELIIGTGTVVETSRDTMPATGTPGWATDGDPASTIPATDFPASHYNMLVAEVVQVILDSGLTLDRTNWGQLSAAIQSLIATSAATAASSLAAESATRSSQIATLTADVSNRVSGIYGKSSGDYQMLGLYQQATTGRPVGVYNNGTDDVYAPIANYVDVTTVQTNLTTEAATRAAADAALTTNVNARVSGAYGVGTGMYDGKALIQGAAGPSFCYNNGSSDVWLGLLYGVQSSISGGTRTTINGQKMLIYYIDSVMGTNFKITFPESFSAVPSVFVTATSEFTTNLSAWINIVTGTVTETGFEVNVNATEGGEASTHGAGVWVFAFGAA